MHRHALIVLALAAGAAAQTPGTQAACASSIKDQTAVGCLEAASIPTLGLLYPLSRALNVSLVDQVGLGTFSPNSRLHVDGDGIHGEDLLRVQRNGKTRFFIDSDGQVAVGDFFDPDRALTVHGQIYSENADPNDARGIEGYASDDSGGRYGTLGFAAGTAGVGVYGEALSPVGNTAGVQGVAVSPDGRGVLGYHVNLDGTAAAVMGQTLSSSAYASAVWGLASNQTPGPYSAGVRGESAGTGSNGIGVYGSHDAFGWGVYGVSSSGVGVYARSSTGTALYASGDLAVTGTKNFVQPHPTDPAKEIAFVCLEGNESGTYCRGEGVVVGGFAVIQVPEEFRLVSEPDGLTIQLTSVGGRADLWVESIDLDQVVIGGEADVTFHYFLNGVRRGYADYQVVRENRSFRPSQGVQQVTETTGVTRALLIQNGILHPDGSLNLDTAARLGWDVHDEVAPPAKPAEPGLIGPSPRPVLLEERQ